MRWKPLALENRQIIESYLKSQDLYVSDLTFTNLYLWHYSRLIWWCEFNGCLLIKVQYPNEDPFLFYPVEKVRGSVDKKTLLQEIIHIAKNRSVNLSFHSLSTRDKDELESLMPDTFNFEYREDRSDYIYSIPELIALKGKKYHKKKTHLNRFLERYAFIYEEMSAQNALEVIEVYKDWFSQISDDIVSEGLRNEYIGIIETLKVFSQMSYSGAIIRLQENNQIIAFSLGEQLDSNSVVIHIEKANILYQGAYQAINQQFLANRWSEFELVNREEDLGIEGLRKAKMSYQPLFLEKKFNATIKI